MKERPIIFSTEMVRAILEGRKTQTRRIIKPQPILLKDWACHGMDGLNFGAFTIAEYLVSDPKTKWEGCPYGQPGDRIWVKETWAEVNHAGSHIGGMPKGLAYKADTQRDYHWKPSIHMPRWASRITLEITNVRIERVQDITAGDCVAEGIPEPKQTYGEFPKDFNKWTDKKQDEWIKDRARTDYFRATHNTDKILNKFTKLWESIHGPGAWERNDWVWVIEFKPVPQE